jgi:hypothetical protein
MKEEHRFDHPLQQIYQQVVSANVCQFVREQTWSWSDERPLLSVAGNEIIGRTIPIMIGSEMRWQNATTGVQLKPAIFD